MLSIPAPRRPASDCLFCAAHDDPEETLVWHDRPLMKTDGVGVAIPGVGAFVPGYVLVSPAQHRSAIQDLPGGHGSRFLDFIRHVVGWVEAVFGPVTIFEHGSCRDEERRRSACLTHSHLHILPGSYSFGSLGLSVTAFDDLSGFMGAREGMRVDGYLMYKEPGGPVCYAPDAGVSQYFRRHIAKMLACPDEWDYALFPRWPNVQATRQTLTSGTRPGHEVAPIT